MAHASSLVFAGIAPHPPIMVPEVGREAAAEVRQSIAAMADLTERVIAAAAQTVVIISPHAPLQANAFIAYDGPRVYGDFRNFRAPAATIEAEVDAELLSEIARTAGEEELVLLKIRDTDLDHGSAVPLYFLQRNGWAGKVIVLGYSFLSNEEHVRFGRCIRRALENLGRPVAFIASGDLSHRLKRGAPAGYNPDAHLFDEEVVDALRKSEIARIVEIDQDMRHMAGECGYRSMLVAIGVAEGPEANCEVISYEAPFGVGYLVAQLFAAKKRESNETVDTKVGAEIPALARRAVEKFVETGAVWRVPADVPRSLRPRAGCFVSIKTLAGELRGCIGTIDPAKETLAEEIVWNAISAATRDPRFAPVAEQELAHLRYSVDVLSVPEPCTFAELDPKIYGVIVETENGTRRGLLLPNLNGIETAAQQVEIASRKAGLLPGVEVKLFRFRAERYSE